MDYSKINIRTASPEDIESILAIESESFDTGIAEDKAAILERLNTFPEGFLVMEHSGMQIGYISSEVWPRHDTPKPEHFILGHSIESLHSPDLSSGCGEIYISSMGILKSFRGRALGKLLFESFISHVLSSMPCVASAILVVSKNWQSARNIYAQNGFKEVMILESFFKSGSGVFQDGMVMRCDFSNR